MQSANAYVSKIETLDRSDYVILLDDLEFRMTKRQLKEITRLNNLGYGVNKISEKVKRDPHEVIIALLHQSRKGSIPLKRLRL